MLRLIGLLVFVVTAFATPAVAADYYWKWDDGSKAISRSFAETAFDSPR